MSEVRHGRMCSDKGETCQQRETAACGRILSPSLEALRSTFKPQITGAVSMGCFKVPPYLTVTSNGLVHMGAANGNGMASSETSPSDGTNESNRGRHCDGKKWSDIMIDIHAFCEHVGYPLMIKGTRNGAALCNSWSAISARLSSWRCSLDVNPAVKPSSEEDSHSNCECESDLFLQKHVSGAEKTIAFAAVDGELTGCVTMTKYIHTAAGKVWGGAITPVEVGIVGRLESFLADTLWTGGGEIEFIETDRHEWFVIDFNPRLPAWIMATCFTGCNLPADLLAHAIARRGEGDKSLPVVRSGNYSKARGHFTRSVVEVPQCNYAVHRQSQDISSLIAVSKRAGGAGSTTHSRSLVRKTPNTFDVDPAGNIGYDDENKSSSSDISVISPLCSSPSVASLQKSPEWVLSLCRAASHVMDDPVAVERGSTVATPCYILCRNTIEESLNAHKSFVENARNAAGLAKSLDLSLCISVKTQPHPNVLKMALDAGYLAECISMAEVRSALATGFSSQSIILTGPGKFWEGRPNHDWRINTSLRPMKLRAIFADSLSDLRTVVQRVCDPNDWLFTSMVGIRFAPVCGPRSRFGLDSSDPAVLLAAAQIIKTLPVSMHIGIHFHYASSGPGSGLPLWRNMVNGMATLARNFGALCCRTVRVMDVGGGWSPSFIQQPDSTKEMTALLRRVYNEFVAVESNQKEKPLTIQFEPGKSLTERAGGIICRVLCIREISCVAGVKPRDGENEGTIWQSIAGDGNFTTIRRAIIVDACVGDVSSPHVHPIFWRPQHGHTRLEQSAGLASPVCMSDRDSGAQDMWSELEPGMDQIWGRSCMEFDVLTSGCGAGGTTSAAGVRMPVSLREGDFVLIAATGAYDMSMQYDFADGVGRRCRIVNA
jgi:diaminopimelate decarboxylase